DQFADRIIPAHRLEVAGAAIAGALHRLDHPIGVIGDLNRRLPARAQAALADRILGQAFEFLRDAHRHDAGLAVAGRLDVGLHDADVDRAARRARRTDARLPLGNARRQILVAHQADPLMLRVPATRQRRARPGDRRELDEVPALHGYRSVAQRVGWATGAGWARQVGRPHRVDTWRTRCAVDRLEFK